MIYYVLRFTAQWVDSKFQRRSAVLQAQELSERHTEEHIAIKITKMLSDWNISLPKMLLLETTEQRWCKKQIYLILDALPILYN